jgi:hypothetical protein
MTTVTTIHAWEVAGLGRAPFRFVGLIAVPPPSLLEANVDAYNHAVSGSHAAAGALGVTLCSCQACGKDIMNNCVICDADGNRFVVGTDCVAKTGDAGLIDAARAAEKARRRARADAEREARWEADRPAREARVAEFERQQREREAAEAARARVHAEANAWLIDVLAGQPGDFCRSVAADLGRMAIGDLSGRCLDICRDIYAKAMGGRKGSKAFTAAAGDFDRRSAIGD